jgi:hypothetical protein
MHQHEAIIVSTVMYSLASIIVLYVIYGWKTKNNHSIARNAASVVLVVKKTSSIATNVECALTKMYSLTTAVKPENTWQNVQYVTKIYSPPVVRVTNCPVITPCIGIVSMNCHNLMYVVRFVKRQCWMLMI